MSALYVCLLRRHRATKMYVSMSVSVQCMCADVEGNDVPTIWCIRQYVFVCVAVCCYVPHWNPHCLLQSMSALAQENNGDFVGILDYLPPLVVMVQKLVKVHIGKMIHLRGALVSPVYTDKKMVLA